MKISDLDLTDLYIKDIHLLHTSDRMSEEMLKGYMSSIRSAINGHYLKIKHIKNFYRLLLHPFFRLTVFPAIFKFERQLYSTKYYRDHVKHPFIVSLFGRFIMEFSNTLMDGEYAGFGLRTADWYKNNPDEYITFICPFEEDVSEILHFQVRFQSFEKHINETFSHHPIILNGIRELGSEIINSHQFFYHSSENEKVEHFSQLDRIYREKYGKFSSKYHININLIDDTLTTINKDVIRFMKIFENGNLDEFIKVDYLKEIALMFKNIQYFPITMSDVETGYNKVVKSEFLDFILMFTLLFHDIAKPLTKVKELFEIPDKLFSIHNKIFKSYYKDKSPRKRNSLYPKCFKKLIKKELIEFSIMKLIVQFFESDEHITDYNDRFEEHYKFLLEKIKINFPKIKTDNLLDLYLRRKTTKESIFERHDLLTALILTGFWESKKEDIIERLLTKYPKHFWRSCSKCEYFNDISMCKHYSKQVLIENIFIAFKENPNLRVGFYKYIDNLMYKAITAIAIHALTTPDPDLGDLDKVINWQYNPYIVILNLSDQLNWFNRIQFDKKGTLIPGLPQIYFEVGNSPYGSGIFRPKIFVTIDYGDEIVETEIENGINIYYKQTIERFNLFDFETLPFDFDLTLKYFNGNLVHKRFMFDIYSEKIEEF